MWECITRLKADKTNPLHGENHTTFFFLRDETVMLLERRKGSNPENERGPAVKCPLCKKNLFYVRDATARNNKLVYDLRDPQYSFLPRDLIIRCSRCHKNIGITTLDTERRRLFGFPLLHEKINPLKNN